MTKFAVILAIYITSFVVMMACNVGELRPAYIISFGHVWTAFVVLIVPAMLGFIIGLKMGRGEK